MPNIFELPIFQSIFDSIRLIYSSVFQRTKRIQAKIKFIDHRNDDNPMDCTLRLSKSAKRPHGKDFITHNDVNII